MKVLINIILSLIIISTLSCEKDAEKKDSILIVGNKQNINHTFTELYDSLISDFGMPTSSPVSKKLDVDNDGMMDIAFYSKAYWHNFTQSYECYFETLHESINIASNVKMDTIFEIDYFGLADSIVKKQTDKDYYREGIITTIIKPERRNSIKNFVASKNIYAKKISLNDTIDDKLEWYSGMLKLSSDYLVSYTDSNDSTFINLSRYLSYKEWNDQEAYIGIQIKEDATIKYGWLLIKVEDCYKIYFKSQLIDK